MALSLACSNPLLVQVGSFSPHEIVEEGTKSIDIGIHNLLQEAVWPEACYGSCCFECEVNGRNAKEMSGILSIFLPVLDYRFLTLTFFLC